MTKLQEKTLIDAGFSDSAIDTILQIIGERQDDLVKKKDLSVVEIRLQKEIREVELRLQKEIREVELRLQKEIKEVELKIKDSELRLQKEIREVERRLQKEIKDLQKEIQQAKNDITVRMMYFFSPFYIGMLSYFVKQIFFS